MATEADDGGFGSAFASFASSGKPPEPAAEPDPALADPAAASGEPAPAADDTTGGAPAADAPGADGTPAGGADGSGAGEPGGGAQPAAAPHSGADAGESPDDILRRLAPAVKEQPAPEPAAAPAAQPATPAPVYSAEGQGFLENYDKEWPDVRKA